MSDLGETSACGSIACTLRARSSTTRTRASRAHQQMKQEASQVYTDFQTATAFMRPEIARRRPRRRSSASSPRNRGSRQYRMFFDDILRAAPHTLSPAEEKIVARAGAHGADRRAPCTPCSPTPTCRIPEVTLSTGEKVRLDAAAYTQYRASPVKADRDAVFKAFWERYGEFTRTLATTLNAHVQTHVFNKDVHKFGSSLEAALFDYNIPTSVYTQLIADVHANLPTLHRYLQLRQKIMGLPQLGYEDLYAPIVDSVDLQLHARAGAWQLTLEAFAPLGAGVRRRAAQGLRVALGRLPAEHRQAPGRVQHHRSTACTRTSCSTSPAPATTSRRWRTSRATRCTRTWRARTSRTRPRLLDLRRRGGLDAEREPAVPPRARPDRRTTATRLFLLGELPRHDAHHAVPPDAVRRVRAAHPRGGGARRAAHRRVADEAVPGAAAQVLRARPGRRAGRRRRTAPSGPTSRTSTTTSTSTSTRPA